MSRSSKRGLVRFCGASKIVVNKVATGFTLMEVLVGMGIFIMLMGFTLANFRNFQRSTSLEIEADKFALLLRQAHLWALAGQRTAGNRPEGGYGVQIVPCVSPPCSYTLFADVYPSGAPNHLYDPGQDIVVSAASLPLDIIIPRTTPSYPSTVAFLPPKGQVFVIVNGGEQSEEFVVTFQSVGGGPERNVRLSRVSGRVNLE